MPILHIPDKSPVFSINGKDVAINLFTFSPGVGTANVGSVVYRKTGSIDWEGEVVVLDSSNEWTLENQKAMGGFQSWISMLKGRINNALATIFGVSVATDPQTFKEVIDWVNANLKIVADGTGARVV